MDQQQLIDRLEERVADIPVGIPPVDVMRAAARRRRRGRAAVAAGAVAVAVVAAGAIAWQSVDPEPRTPVAADPGTDAPPAGHRYVGLGSAVIAVPDAWGTNEVSCGTPMEDTVVINQGAVCMMLVPRPEDVESVEVRSADPEIDRDFLTWTAGEVDGQRAYWSPVDTEGGVASGSVYLPDERALFVAQSSSANGSAIVGNLLSGVAILRDDTTVPGFADLSFDRDPRPAAKSYAERLEGSGLSMKLVEKASPMNPGDVLETDPAVGSVVAPGDTVVVTIAR